MLYSTETNYDPTLGGLKAVWIGLQGENSILIW